MAWILLAFAITALVIVHQARIADAKKARKAAEDAKRAADEAKRAADEAAQRFQEQIDALNRELLSLRPFANVRDAMAATAALREQGRRILADAAKEATVIRAAALTEADQVRSEAAGECAQA